MSNYDYIRATLIGNVGNNPVASGEGKKPFASVSIARSKEYKQGDEIITEPQWHQCVFYGHLAELVKQYVKKGSRLFVEGELENQKWQDKEGKVRYSSQIVVKELRFLDSKKEDVNERPKQLADAKRNVA